MGQNGIKPTGFRVACRLPVLLTGLLIVPILAGFIQGEAYAQKSVSRTMSAIQRQLALLDAIQPYVEQPDILRLVALRASSQGALDSLRKDPTAVRGETVRRIQDLIIQYGNSRSFLGQIRTEVTAASIAELIRSADDFRRTYDPVSNPSDATLLASFRQMDRIMIQLVSFLPASGMRTQLQRLEPALSRTAVLGEGTDKTRFYDAMIAECQEIRTLYSAFRGAPPAASAALNELQGLNEFLIQNGELRQSVRH
jgi:hypothetical protein